MINKINNIYQEIEDLERNSRIVKTAHFLAVQRKQITHRILSLATIIINIIIFSPLLDLIIHDYSAIAVKFLAIISASLAGIQALFSYQKDVELHLSAGDKYANIYHKVGLLLAKYKDSLIKEEDLVKEFDTLFQEYLNANSQYKACIPSNDDYEKAKNSLKKRSPSKTVPTADNTIKQSQSIEENSTVTIS